MKRWTHLHSVGAGALGMTLAATHTIWMLTITLAAGILIGSSWRGLKRGVNAGGALIAARVATEDERRGLIRAERRRKLALANVQRDRLDRAHALGVMEGRMDRDAELRA